MNDITKLNLTDIVKFKDAIEGIEDKGAVYTSLENAQSFAEEDLIYYMIYGSTEHMKFPDEALNMDADDFQEVLQDATEKSRGALADVELEPYDTYEDRLFETIKGAAQKSIDNHPHLKQIRNRTDGTPNNPAVENSSTGRATHRQSTAAPKHAMSR